MSEMIERVGRALAKQEGYAYDPLPYDERACAAIEAMRDATVEMYDMGHSEFIEGGDIHSVWTAMVDEALKAD